MSETIAVSSFDDLLRMESEIVKRIEQFPNGGKLFLVHPFRLLNDVGIDVAPALQEQLAQRYPELSGFSDAPYEALKAAKGQQNVRFRVHGLFRRK